MPRDGELESEAESTRFISLVTRDTLALVLAGGRGTRLGGLTRQCAKPAVPFGGRFRIIDFPLSNCINSGIRRISVLTQYMAHPLIRHIQQGWSFLRGEFGEFVELVPAQQRLGESWYQGTADAVFQNLDIIGGHQPQFVLVLGGDHVYKMDYGLMLGFHVAQNAEVTVGCVDVPLEEGRSFGIMGVDAERRVTRFEEKPDHPSAMPDMPDRALASMGIYVFNTAFLVAVLEADAADPDSSHDFGKDIVPRAVAQGRSVYAHRFTDDAETGTGYWRDVGNLDAYWSANLELAAVTPELDLYDQAWPIWTYQEQVPPAKFVLDEEKRRGEAVNSMVAGGSIVSGALVRGSVLFSEVLVAEGAEVEETVVLPRAVIGAGCHIRRAIVDTCCYVPDGVRIGFDPAEDRARFEVSPGGIVLVTREALEAL